MTRLHQASGTGPARLTKTHGGFGGDIDGLFGLLVDNLIQLLLILFLLDQVVKIPRDVVLTQIMPAVGISVVIGNLFYAAQAYIGSKREGRRKTALPYGVNTPSVFVYVLFIMLPVYLRTNSWEAAYAAGMVACIGSGLIEFFGAFVAKWIRTVTPRAAMLSALAGIALTFISMDFVVRIFTDPLIALIPLAILLAGYFGRARMPLGLPAGLVALVVGAAAAWILTYVRSVVPGLDWLIHDGDNLRSWKEVKDSVDSAGWYLADPRAVWDDIRGVFMTREWVSYLGVIIPMGIFNLVGSLQNLESAEAAGDRYATAPSLMVNGIGSILGGFLGSCFPTTIYIGHPGWKGMGAGWLYSLMNAVAIGALCLTGIVTCVEAVIPIAAGAGILLWIGVIICAQAFTATPKEHAGAVAVGLFPAIAGLIVMISFSPYQIGPQQVQLIETAGPNVTDVGTEGMGVNQTEEVSSPSTDERSVLPPSDIDGLPISGETGQGDGKAESDDASPVAPGVLDDQSASSSEHELIDTPPPSALRISTVQEQLESDNPDARKWAGFSIHGLIRLERGLLLISMLWAAIAAFLTDRRWTSAGIVAMIAAALTLLGVIHSYAILGNDLYYLIPGLDVPDDALRSFAWEFVAAYVIIGVVFLTGGFLTGGAPGGARDQASKRRDQMAERFVKMPAARAATSPEENVDQPIPIAEDDQSPPPPSRPI